jgi:hypothetical protein
MDLSLNNLAAVVSLASAFAAWAVIPWRVSQVEERIKRLEQSERDASVRLASIETELRLTRHTLERIAEKLDVS